MRPLPRILFLPLTLLALAAMAGGCDALTDAQPPTAAEARAEAAGGELRRTMHGRIVVANRTSGTASVISTRTAEVLLTVRLPQGEIEPEPEPMYVVYDAPTDRVFIGDRTNNRVVAYDARTALVVGTIPATGIFHMWADPGGAQLWVVDDVGNRMTVIDPATLDVLATVPVAGGVPHDTVLEPDGSFAYVTVFVEDGPDQIVKYRTDTFAEVARTVVGENPHLAINDIDGQLYSPCQGSDAVFVLDRATLGVVTTIPVPGAHGAWMARGGKTFFTTNLPGGGTDGLFAIDTRTNSVIGSVDTTPDPVIPTPRNVASPPSGRKIYVTHSGATANQTTVYTLDEDDPMNPDLVTSEVITVGMNPFGIGYVPSR